jgi:hypothetical protein
VERPSDRLIELVALRQAQRRQFNDRLADLGDLDEGAVPFRCECALVGCGSTVRLTLPEYASVRADPGHFIVLAGHVEPEADTVVDTRRGWVTIAKPPGAGRDVALRTAAPATRSQVA